MLSELDVGWRSTSLIALVAPIALAAVAIAIRGVDRRANRWLALLLFAFAWQTVPAIIGFAGAYQAFPWLTFAPFGTELLFGPLLFLHAYSLGHRKPHPRTVLLLVPGCVQLVYSLVLFAILDTPTKFAFSASFHGPYVARAVSIGALILGILGAVLAWRESRSYLKHLQSKHAAADNFDPFWLRRFVVIVSGLVTIWIGFELWGLFGVGLSYQDAYWLDIAAGVGVLWLALDGLTRVELVFPKIDALPSAPLSPQRSAANDLDSEPPLKPASIAEQVRTSGWHRDPGLSLAKLARHLGTNTSYLSRSINSGMGKNFNRFINEIRVEEVCKLLASPELSQPILTIALEVGFASKATFNRVFRQLTGTSPSAYRKAQVGENSQS